MLKKSFFAVGRHSSRKRESSLFNPAQSGVDSRFRGSDVGCGFFRNLLDFKLKKIYSDPKKDFVIDT